MNSKEYFFDEVIKETARGYDVPLRVLELGCGTAKYVPAMIAKYPKLEYVGIEPIPESFNKATQILKDVPRTKISSQLGYDAIEGLEDGSFDVVISFSVLEHVKQLGKFIDLSARYVKQGGLMVHRYDLGHALYPGSLKERLHVWLGNTIPSVLPEIKFVRYVPLLEVVDLYVKYGVTAEAYTYHQMPGHKKLEKELTKLDLPPTALTEVYQWELDHADAFAKLPLNIREKLFPTVAVWGRKNGS